MGCGKKIVVLGGVFLVKMQRISGGTWIAITLGVGGVAGSRPPRLAATMHPMRNGNGTRTRSRSLCRRPERELQ